MLTNVARLRQIAAGAAATAGRASRLPLQKHKHMVRAFCVYTPLAAKYLSSEGVHTQQEADEKPIPSRSPFYFDTAYSIFAKRPTRPFPPPFVSRPSGSFSDPLTTHDRAKYRQARVDGQLLRGITNGDDAILIGHNNFLAVNDGVGAWAQKPRGHAALWSRLIAHYWALEAEKVLEDQKDTDLPLEAFTPTAWLQTALDKTKVATTSSTPSDVEGDTTTTTSTSNNVDGATESNDILGTTTSTCVVLHHRSPDQAVVLATQLGDCAAFIIRPGGGETDEGEAGGDAEEGEEGEEGEGTATGDKLLYKTTEQWHWFDCPRQLGSRSHDTPEKNAVTDTIDVQVDDIVVVMSDGVTDNLWEHEITANVCKSFRKWRAGDAAAKDGLVFVARELMNAAKVVALDNYAESPYMERALDEGLAAEGGKLDDISVVIGVCRKREN